MTHFPLLSAQFQAFTKPSLSPLGFLAKNIHSPTAQKKEHEIAVVEQTDVLHADDTSQALSLDHFITVPQFFPAIWSPLTRPRDSVHLTQPSSTSNNCYTMGESSTCNSTFFSPFVPHLVETYAPEQRVPEASNAHKGACSLALPATLFCILH